MKLAWFAIWGSLVACAPLETESRESLESDPTLVEPAAKEVESEPREGGQSDREIVISAIGDCTLGDPVGAEASRGSFHDAFNASGRDLARPFSLTKRFFEEDDLTIANLETTLGTQKCRTDVAFAFRGAPEFAGMLSLGGVDIVNIANNHTDDCGSAGRAQTLEALTGAGVGYFGFGHVDRRTIRGVEIINLGYTGGRTEFKPRMMRDVTREKRPDNLVFVSFHWGKEGSPVVIPEQRTLGRAAIDAGADLVLGHHPHVLQGIESYKDRRIVYSLGNFVFGGNSKPSDIHSMIYRARFRVGDGAPKFVGDATIPVKISSTSSHNDFRPIPLEGAEREAAQAAIDAMRISPSKR
jgi:poly-gamma-glutamate capsule biosynthesis protein CapA/YwtB (metallophosphatase superfamily)